MTLGGGQHGLLGELVPPQLYTNALHTPYVAPVDPGPTPSIAGINNNQERQAIKLHKYHWKQFDEVDKFWKITKEMIIGAIENQYLATTHQIHSTFTVRYIFFIFFNGT